MLTAVALAACSSGPSRSLAPGTGSPSGSAGSTASSQAGTPDPPEQILPAPVTGATTIQSPPRPVTPPPAIDGLLAWDTTGYPGTGTPGPDALPNDHVPGPVSYAVTPPVGGPHNPIWMNAGVYTAPVPSERAVHLLEHGAVWITYRPGLAADQVTALTAFVAQQLLVPENGSGAPQANRYLVLSPWASADLPAPVVISSWGYQLRVDSPSDPRLQAFVDTFRHTQTYSPEYGSPMDGVPILTGGRPASNGSAQPNPDGSVPAP